MDKGNKHNEAIERVIELGTIVVDRILGNPLPRLLPVDRVRKALLAVEGISGVDRLHVWSLGTGHDAIAAAAVVAGALSLGDAVKVICRRSRLMSTIAGSGAMASVELPAAQVLSELAARGIGLWLAELKGPAKDALVRYGLVDVIGPERLYPTIGQAVRAHVTENQVP